MENSILIRYGELFLKGKNKIFFEQTLLSNIRRLLQGVECNLYKISGRFVVNKYKESDEILILNTLKNVFGLHSISPAKCLKTNVQDIKNYLSTIKISTDTFKVNVKRADKTFPITSIEFERELGGLVLENNKHLKVSLGEPQTTVYIDIRENGETFIFYNIIKGAGGMPTGTSGKAMLLLSGGIDSPVAGYQMAKRGLTLHAIHFHSFPYTSELALEKVKTLAHILTQYVGDINLHIVPFTKIQEEIHKNCNSEFMITIMRRFMMQIAEQIALKNGVGAIVTGESLAQVASQTLESITVTNSVVKQLPVFRPLISNDKEEIIEIAKKINTFETSILPYEDCCTVFLPEHPLIKPKLEKVVREETKLDVASLIESAINNTETVLVKNN